MANVDFTTEIDNFRNAIYGKDVRASMVSMAEKLQDVANRQVLVLDDTLTRSDAAAEAEAVGHLVQVSSTQPSSNSNLMWINPNQDEVEIPTVEDLEGVEGEIDDLKTAVMIYRGNITDANSSPDDFNQIGSYYVSSAVGNAWYEAYGYPFSGISRFAVIGGDGNSSAYVIQLAVKGDTLAYRAHGSSSAGWDSKWHLLSDVDISDIHGEIDFLNGSASNLFDDTISVTKGAYLDSNGTVIEGTANAWYTGLIPVTEETQYTTVYQGNGSVRVRVHVYDSNDEWLEQIDTFVASTGLIGRSFVTPTGATSLRVSALNSTISLISVYPYGAVGFAVDSVARAGLNTLEDKTFVASRKTLTNDDVFSTLTTPGSYYRGAPAAEIGNAPTDRYGYCYTMGTSPTTPYHLYQASDESLYAQHGSGKWALLALNNTWNNRLYGKTLVIMGTSMVYGQGISSSKRWTTLLQDAYSMTVDNQAHSSQSIAYFEGEGETYPYSMVTQLPDVLALHESVDYFILQGGANDYARGIPLGDVDSTDVSTFCGAINYIITQVLNTWAHLSDPTYTGPRTRVLLMTSYDRKIRSRGDVNDETYVNAMIEVAKYRGIPYFDNYHELGQTIRDANNDVTTSPITYGEHWFFPKTLGQHISEEGHAWVAPIYAKKLETI